MPRRQLLALPALLWPGAAAAASTTPADTLVIGMNADLPPLDQAMNWRTPTAVLVGMAYERLIRLQFNPATGGYDFVPWIAKTWESSKDGRTWTFHIGDGHRFHDGSPVTARDVKFSIDRIIALKRGPAAGFSFIARIDAPDPRTVVFRLHEPSAAFFPLLANSIGAVISAKIMAYQVGSDFGSAWLNTRTFGSGPYVLEPVTQISRLFLRRNPYYGGKVGPIRRIVIETVPDASIRALRLTKGDIDMAIALPPEALDGLRGKPGVVVRSGLANAFTHLALNTRSGPMADVRVRRAVALGIDWKNLGLAARGRGRVVQGPLTTAMLGGEPDRYPNRHDPAAARRLLAQAGIRKGTRLSFIYTSASSLHDMAALVIQASLQAIGLNPRLERMTGIAATEATTRGRFDMVLFDWNPAYAEPAMMLNFWLDPAKIGTMGNKAFYANPEVGRLIQASDKALDPKARAEMIRRAVALSAADVPYVYLLQRTNAVAVSSRLQGYPFDPNFSANIEPDRYWKTA